MADQSKAISELNAHTAPAGEDLLVIVDDPSGTAPTKKITVTTLFSNTANLTVVSNTLVTENKQTPANSSVTVRKGTIFFDDTYLYIATANNTLKRVTLESF